MSSNNRKKKTMTVAAMAEIEMVESMEIDSEAGVDNNNNNNKSGGCCNGGCNDR